MTKATRNSRLALSIRRCLMAAPLALAACNSKTANEKEIFIEAVPASTSEFSQLASGDKKGGATHAITLGFDDSAYFVGPNSSLLYRGEYLSYIRDQGYLKPGSIMVSRRTASWHGPLIVLPTLEKGRPYTASIWIKLIETDQPSPAKLVWKQIADGVETNLTLAEVIVEPRIWVKLEGEFIGGTQPESVINTLSLDVDEIDVKYLVDDIIVAYAELSAELQASAVREKTKVSAMITNGGVEDGLEPWSNQGGVISRSSAYAHTGKYSLLIAGRRQEWNAPMLTVKGMENDKVYRFSIFVRMNDGEPATDVKFTMKRTTAGQTTFMSLGSGMATSHGWSEVSGTFSAANISDSEYVSVYLEAGHPTASYFVDTLTVEPVQQ